PPHLPLPVGAQRAAHPPPAHRQGPPPRRTTRPGTDPVAQRTTRRLPLPPRPRPAQAALHTRPVHGAGRGADRPADLPHLRPAQGLLHPALHRRVPGLRQEVEPMTTNPNTPNVKAALTPKRRRNVVENDEYAAFVR